MIRLFIGYLGFVALIGGLAAATACRAYPAVRTPGIAAAGVGAFLFLATLRPADRRPS